MAKSKTVRLTVPRVHDPAPILEAFQEKGVAFFPRLSDSEPDPIMEVEGAQYIGEASILMAINTPGALTADGPRP